MDKRDYVCSACFDVKSSISCYACSFDDYEDIEEHDLLSIQLDPAAYSYYGRIPTKETELGVIYHMLDQYIEKIINKHAQAFQKKQDAILKEFKSKLKDQMNEQKRSIAFLNKQMTSSHKRLNAIEERIRKIKILNAEDNVISLANKVSKQEEKEMKQVKESLIKKGIIKKAPQNDIIHKKAV